MRQLKEGAAMEFDACMVMEYRLSQHCMAGNDFFEGVRALLVDKDKKPQWQPPTLAEVSEELVDGYFAPLGGAGADVLSGQAPTETNCNRRG